MCGVPVCSIKKIHEKKFMALGENRRPVHTLTTVEGLLLLVPPGFHGVVGMMFMHMRSMFLYVICLLHVYVCYVSLVLELDMLFVVSVVCL